MQLNRSLRFRITAAFMVLVSVASSILAVTAFLADEQLEEQQLNETLQRETEQLKRLILDYNGASPTDSATTRFYVVPPDSYSDIPAEIRALPRGLHHSVDVGERSYHVSRDAQGGQELFIIQDITQIERQELALRYLLLVVVVAAAFFSLVAGYLLSRIAIIPVTQFAERVSNLGPDERRVSLSREFAGFEIGSIALAFDRYLARLDEFIEREHNFTAEASHELRTPLTVIAGAAELLLSQPGLDAGQREPLQRIRRACEQMTGLTDALLFLARGTDSVPPEGARCSLVELLPEIVDSHRHLLAGKPVTLELELLQPASLRAPDTAIEIVVGNLLRNAIAYTEHGSIRLRAEGQVLSIEDSGRGIRPEDLGRIFERHYRSHDSRGLGLGLYLAKRVCERYGWRIDASSPEGGGTRFVLRFSDVLN